MANSKSNAARKSEHPQANTQGKKDQEAFADRKSHEGPGIVKARNRSDANERLAKRLAEATKKNEERIAKVRERERLRALERKAWASLLARQKAERDEYRNLKLHDRIATISDENVRDSAAA